MFFTKEKLHFFFYNNIDELVMRGCLEEEAKLLNRLGTLIVHQYQIGLNFYTNNIIKW